MSVEEQRKAKNRRNRAAGARYAYVVLAVMCLLLGAGSYLYTNYRSDHDVMVSNHKFCRLMNASLEGQPVPKPADAKKYPARAKLYHDYIIVHDLAVDLGCIPR